LLDNKNTNFPIWKANIFYAVYILYFIGALKLVIKLITNPVVLTLAVQLGMLLPFIVAGYFLLHRETDLTTKSRINLDIAKISTKSIVLTIFLAFFARQVHTFLNNIVIVTFPTSFNPALYATDDSNLLILILTSGVVVGICEELLYRGCLYEMFAALGKTRCMFLTSLLFAINHFDIYNLLASFFMGCLLFIIRDRTGSIIPAIILHIINNTLSDIKYATYFSEQGRLLLLGLSIIVVMMFMFSYKINKGDSQVIHTKLDKLSFVLYVIPLSQFIKVTYKLLNQ